MLLLQCLWETTWALESFDVCFFKETLVFPGQLWNLAVVSGTLYFFKQPLWLQDVSIREHQDTSSKLRLADNSINKKSRRYDNRLRNGNAIFDYSSKCLTLVSSRAQDCAEKHLLIACSVKTPKASDYKRMIEGLLLVSKVNLQADRKICERHNENIDSQGKNYIAGDLKY